VEILPKGPQPGDLWVGLANPCTLSANFLGHLSITVTVQPEWTTSYALAFPATDFLLSTTPGSAVTTGPVTSTAPFTATVGGQTPSIDQWLGKTVSIALTIDPNHNVPESNYNNNTNHIEVNVPARVPVGAFSRAINCYGI
jgi:hypothetical protein